MDDPSITIILPKTLHTHTIIFLHGRGDTAVTFADSLKQSCSSSGLNLFEHLPSVRWVFPTAPIQQCANGWLTGQRMNSQWFDIWNVANFQDREELQADGLRESVQRIRQIILHEIQTLDGRSHRIVLAGISQGAATAVHTLLHLNLPSVVDDSNHPLPKRIGAFLGFSCRMPFPGRTLAETRAVLDLNDVPSDNEILRNTPVLLEHCADDPLVLVELGRALRDTLQDFGMQGTWKEYSSGGHWFNAPQGVDDVIAFLEGYAFNGVEGR